MLPRVSCPGASWLSPPLRGMTTMKRTILTSVSALALLTAGSAMAQNNTSDITQDGSGQNATVTQTDASSSDSDIDQSNANNTAAVTQAGADNYSNVAQTADGASATVSQDSSADAPTSNAPTKESSVIQSGDSDATGSQPGERAEARRVGKECGRTCNSR